MMRVGDGEYDDMVDNDTLSLHLSFGLAMNLNKFL